MQILTAIVHLCFFLHFVQCSPTYGTMYALLENFQLATVNIQTGVMTLFGTPVPNEIPATSLAAIDSKNKIFYAIGYNNVTNQVSLIGLSLSDASIMYTVALPFQEGELTGFGMGMDVDQTTGDVIVMGHDASVNNEHHIFRVHPKSGTMKSVGVIAFDDNEGSDGGSIACYDSKHQVFWVQLANISANNITLNLVGVNVTTGKLIFNIIDDVYNVMTLNWDPATGLVYGEGFTLKNLTYRTVVTLNSVSGEFNQVGITNGYSVSDLGLSAFDWNKRVLYTVLENDNDVSELHLVGADSRTGKVLTAPVICSTRNCPLIAIVMFNKPIHW